MQQFSVRERLGVAAAATIVLMLGLGGWAYSRVGSEPSTITPHTANGAPAALEITAGGSPGAKPAVAGPPPTVAAGAAAIIMVHVTGAVRNPGVYKFKDGDRLCDAVHAAGGFKSSADQEALNLADTLQDADQICVPVKDTSPPTAGESAASGDSPRPRQRRNRLRPLIIPGTPHVNVIATAPVQPTADAPVAPAVAPVIPVIATDDAPPTPPQPVVVMHKRGRVVGRTLPRVETVTIDNPSSESPDDVLAGAQVATDPAVAQPIRVGKSRSGKKSSGSSSKSGKGNKFKNPGDGIVHLNSATAAQLEQLPGVGPAMSGRIVEYRTQIGKFTDISQMLDVKGIGDKKFAKMQPFLAL